MKGLVLHLDRDLSARELHVRREADWRLVAVMNLEAKDRLWSITLTNPRPLQSLACIFDQPYELKVVDENVSEAAQLDFGRFRVEIWDEDNVVATVIADAITVE